VAITIKTRLFPSTQGKGKGRSNPKGQRNPNRRDDYLQRKPDDKTRNKTPHTQTQNAVAFQDDELTLLLTQSVNTIVPSDSFDEAIIAGSPAPSPWSLYIHPPQGHAALSDWEENMVDLFSYVEIHHQRMERDIIVECDLTSLFHPEDDAPLSSHTVSLDPTEDSKQDAYEWGSSTAEPDWGRFTHPDHEAEHILWRDTNLPTVSLPTSYHKICLTCGNSLIISDPAPSLTCSRCPTAHPSDTPIRHTMNYDSRATQDDEQEYGRIPIPMSDDSSENYSDLTSASEDGYASDTFLNCMNTITLPHADLLASDDIAFVLGPVRDGVIQHHSLSPIPIHSNPYSPLDDTNEEVIFTQCMQTFNTPVRIQNSSLTATSNKRRKNRKPQPKRYRRDVLFFPSPFPNPLSLNPNPSLPLTSLKKINHYFPMLGGVTRWERLK
jgi:hypothetical protein